MYDIIGQLFTFSRAFQFQHVARGFRDYFVHIIESHEFRDRGIFRLVVITDFSRVFNGFAVVHVDRRVRLVVGIDVWEKKINNIVIGRARLYLSDVQYDYE